MHISTDITHFEHEGAAIIEGKDSTTVVPPDMSFSVDVYGNIAMHIA